MKSTISSAITNHSSVLAFIRKILRTSIPVFLLSVISFVHAENTSDHVKGRNVNTSLVSDFSDKTTHLFHVAVVFDIQPDWHIYWKNPGTTGIPTTINWDFPDGLSQGESYYSVPRRYDNEELIDYIYEEKAIIVTEVFITDPSVMDAATLSITANVDWLECKNICVPGNSRLAISITPDAPDGADPGTLTLIQNTLTVYQQSIDGQFTADNKQIEVFIPGEFDNNNVNSAYFFSDSPINDPAVKQDLSITSTGLLLSTSASDYGKPITLRHNGLLKISYKNGEHTWKFVKLDKVESITAAPERTVGNIPKFLPLLLLAYFGGLILNLMPCVFPVIGLKIMGFVEQAGQDSRKIMVHGLVFTGGVLVSFWVLSGLLLILRSGGQQLGWGFQLQEPWFNYALILLLLSFALSLNGVFEFGMSAIGIGNKLTHKSGVSGSFFSGVLATVVATPCSAPFLAPALGAALALNPVQSLLVFSTIAIGLSTPYLLLSLFPSVLKNLPKPGAWMETFKQFMAFPLYATVAYLIWALSGQIDESTQLNMLLSLVIIALALWIFGRWGTPAKSRSIRYSAMMITVLLIVISILIGHPKEKKAFWEPWSTELVEKYVAEGRTVYVDFTARWCATCQLNKRLVFSSEAVNEAFKSKKIVALKADWTNRDEHITRRLRELGKAAVPVNLIYKNRENEPVILPEVLTPKIVLDALEF
jgi:thiol:disulfide interchange protein/DsbC/DsbD-like thiol-disulfide interchange protein